MPELDDRSNVISLADVRRQRDVALSASMTIIGGNMLERPREVLRFTADQTGEPPRKC